jgi:hypothetical protein
MRGNPESETITIHSRRYEEGTDLSFHPSKPSQGDFVLGFDDHGRPVRLENDIARQHILIHGPDEAARKAVVLNLIASGIANGRGLIYLATGGAGDFANVYATAAGYGRQDDVLLLNFAHTQSGSALSNTANPFAAATHVRQDDLHLTYNDEIKTRAAISNTINPFATGTASHLTQFLLTLMYDDTKEPEPHAFSRGRMTSILSNVMQALVIERDTRAMTLNFATVRGAMTFRRIYDLAYSQDYTHLLPGIRESLRVYLLSLPEFDPAAGGAQSKRTLDHHNFLEMQIGSVLSLIIDRHGPIFEKKIGDVDLFDVIVNNRILVVTMPQGALPGDLRKLEQILFQGLKGWMTSQLSSTIEGSFSQTSDLRSTSGGAPIPFIMENAGRYVTSHPEAMSAQARSLGFSIIVTHDDATDMTHETHPGIVCNTNTRVKVGLAGGHVQVCHRGQIVICTPYPADEVPLGMKAEVTVAGELSWDAEASIRFHTRSERVEAFADHVTHAALMNTGLGKTGLNALMDAAPLSFVTGGEVGKMLSDPDEGPPAKLLQVAMATIAGYPKLRSVGPDARSDDDGLVGLGD